MTTCSYYVAVVGTNKEPQGTNPGRVCAWEMIGTITAGAQKELLFSNKQKLFKGSSSNGVVTTGVMCVAVVL